MTVKNKWTNMSKNKRNFIITELLLGVLLVIGIGFIAYNKLNEKPERIAVVMADVDESHSAAFKYGMKMAASEYGVDVVMISKENLNNMSDEIDVIKQEINKKADAVVFKPTAEKMTEEKSLNSLRLIRNHLNLSFSVRPLFISTSGQSCRAHSECQHNRHSLTNLSFCHIFSLLFCFICSFS